MRARHSAHVLPAFPAYASAFLSPDQLVLGGGGGATRSGIKNKLRLYHVGQDRTLDLVDELELAAGEDAPMSMAADPKSSSLVCGVNSTLAHLEKGENENCRVFSVVDKKLILERTKGTLTDGDVDDYQKVSVLSPDGKLLAVAGAHTLHLLSYPSLTLLAEPIRTEKDKEIYDATFSATTMVVVTTTALLVYDLPTQSTPKSSPSKKKKGKPQSVLSRLHLQTSVEVPPSLGGPTGGIFRGARYNPENPNVIYTAINTTPIRSRKSKTPSRKAFICKWTVDSWSAVTVRKVGDRGLTCFTITPDGKFLGFGASDLTIGLLDAYTLNPVVTILKAHEFPPTTMTFNTDCSLLVSCSADSVRVVSIPSVVSNGIPWAVIFFILLAFIIAVAAFLAQRA